MRPLALLLAASLALVACSDGASSACRELREPEDPQSGVHVLTSGSFSFLTDPPTSGPHVAGPTPAGALDTPVDPAVQVRLLEIGGAMVQYDSSVDANETADLRGIANEAVVVAPAETDLPTPVVATAWTWKLECEEVDRDRLAEFLRSRPLDAPGRD